VQLAYYPGWLSCLFASACAYDLCGSYFSLAFANSVVEKVTSQLSDFKMSGFHKAGRHRDRLDE